MASCDLYTYLAGIFIFYMAAFESADAGVAMDAITARGAEVTSLLSGKNSVAALMKALESPPLQSKSAAIKEANRDIVFKCLESISSDAQIGTCINFPCQESPPPCLSHNPMRLISLVHLWPQVKLWTRWPRHRL